MARTSGRRIESDEKLHRRQDRGLFSAKYARASPGNTAPYSRHSGVSNWRIWEVTGPSSIVYRAQLVWPGVTGSTELFVTYLDLCEDEVNAFGVTHEFVFPQNATEGRGRMVGHWRRSGNDWNWVGVLRNATVGHEQFGSITCSEDTLVIGERVSYQPRELVHIYNVMTTTVEYATTLTCPDCGPGFGVWLWPFFTSCQSYSPMCCRG